MSLAILILRRGTFVFIVYTSFTSKFLENFGITVGEKCPCKFIFRGKLHSALAYFEPWCTPYLLYHTRRFSNHVSRLLSRSHTFAIIVILDLKIHQSMRIHWPFFPKTWTKGHWPLDDLWSHVCWGHMCDSTQGSLCPSPMTIHQCMWIQWSILQNTTYIHTTYYVQNEWSHSLLLNSVQARQKTYG